MPLCPPTTQRDAVMLCCRCLMRDLTCTDRQHLCMQLVHMTDFRKAAVDDICAVHERSYVLGLEKLAARGKDEIVDGAPTYITGTSFNDALQVLPRIPSLYSLTTRPMLRPDRHSSSMTSCHIHLCCSPLARGAKRLDYCRIGMTGREMTVPAAGSWRSHGTGGCCSGGQQRQSPGPSWLCNLPATRAPCCA